jgi:hypothetical protein
VDEVISTFPFVATKCLVHKRLLIGIVVFAKFELAKATMNKTDIKNKVEIRILLKKEKV